MGQPVLESGSNVVLFRNRTRFSIGAEHIFVHGLVEVFDPDNEVGVINVVRYLKKHRKLQLYNRSFIGCYNSA